MCPLCSGCLCGHAVSGKQYTLSVRYKIPVFRAEIEWWCQIFLRGLHAHFIATYLNWYQSVFICLEQCFLQPQFRYSVATHDMMPLSGIIVIPRHCWSHIVQWMAIILWTNLSSFKFSMQCQVCWSLSTLVLSLIFNFGLAHREVWHWILVAVVTSDE